MKAILFACVFLCASFHVISAMVETTLLKPSVERIFSRRKRFLLFPPGSFMKFTCAVGKGLISAYPRGISLTVEEAVYFPIPGSLNDIYPKHLRPKTTTVMPPVSTTSTYVYIPGTYWRFKAQALPKSKVRPIPRPLKTQRIHTPALSYADPHKWQQWAQNGVKRIQYYTPTKFKWNKWTTPSPKWADWAQHSTQKDYKNIYENAKRLSEWRHYHGHRDRRHLFNQINGLSQRFGVDLKYCIMRTICESKNLLLPSGYSMLHDMLRAVFTMPSLPGLADEYGRNACEQELKSKCNMNLLIWLLSGRVKE